MDEQAAFETRAVLAPRRARRSRLALLIPALALVATAWAGLSGRADRGADASPDAAAVVAPSFDVGRSESAVGERAPAQQPPAQVVGLAVQPLDDVEPRALGRDDVVALSGWYVATAITDCPPLAAIYREAALPEVRGDADSWAFCDRSGVLFASRPRIDDRQPMSYFEDNRSKNAGLPAVAVSLVIGVVVPPELEVIGPQATEVVVVGRFVESGEGCRTPAPCPRELVVDHIAWSAE